MGDRVADPRALGFGVFAILTWMYSLVDAGWYGPEMAGSMFQDVATFAAIGLLIAALAAFVRGDQWHATFFMFWTALIWGFRAAMSAGMTAPNAYTGWYDILIVAVSLLLFMSARQAGVGTPEVLVSFLVCVLFLAFALSGWLGGETWTVLGGYVGLVTGAASLWATASAMGRRGGATATT
ncbi:MAG TPA: hypothetical protein VKA44_04680 [Gemmatimonadota bacterium]|nr:hypothetical protein [Gemmatimonadota bacterium]